MSGVRYSVGTLRDRVERTRRERERERKGKKKGKGDRSGIPKAGEKRTTEGLRMADYEGRFYLSKGDFNYCA